MVQLGTRWDVIGLTQGCLVGLKESSLTKQASEGGKAKAISV